MASKSPEVLSLALAGVVALASLGGILIDDVYAGETDAWRVQIVVQDWLDLVLLAPLLAASALGSLRGSRVARLILGGALMYAVYTFAIYGFSVRFNRLFLLYTTALGLSVFALLDHVSRVLREDVQAWFPSDAPVRFPAGVLVALAAVFAALWLSELVPAVVSGQPPAVLEEVGLVTNPVHVLDLSVTLPGLFLSGLWLWQRRALGFALAPMALVFAVVTDVGIVAIILASRAQDLGGELAVAGAIGLAAVVTLIALWRLVAPLLRGASAPQTLDPGRR